jgi:hypothetical protein
VSAFHCQCGFAIDDADEFGDHFRAVFDREDDTGTDGRVHHETRPADAKPMVCACGYQAADAPEFDDHILLVLTPSDNRGNDAETHIPVDTSTPVRLYPNPDAYPDE